MTNAEPDSMIVPMRLQRFLARSGVASRRGSEDLMTAGRVEVNGVVVRELGSKVDPVRDEVKVDGRVVTYASQPAYLMLYKPGGYVTTMSDPQKRPCVADLMPCTRYPGLFPVGRLDRDTTGLLLFTTDGDLAQRLLHPSHHVYKTYEAIVAGAVYEETLDPLRKGITLDDGICAPAMCRVMSKEEVIDIWGSAPASGCSAVEIRIREGRKNQVKRMLGKIGHPVCELHRSHIGPLCLSNLKLGEWRELSEQERSALFACVSSASEHRANR